MSLLPWQVSFSGWRQYIFGLSQQWIPLRENELGSIVQKCEKFLIRSFSFQANFPTNFTFNYYYDLAMTFGGKISLKTVIFGDKSYLD